VAIIGGLMFLVIVFVSMAKGASVQKGSLK